MSLEVQQVEWKMLVPHAARGGLFLLEGSQDLMSVAEAVAADDAARVRGLIESGALARPTDEQLGMDDDTAFRFVIVQPFVIAQGPLA